MTPDASNSSVPWLALDSHLELVFERLARASPSAEKGPPFRIVIPGKQLEDDSLSLAALLTSMLAEFEDIERVLQSLQEQPEIPADPSTPRILEDAVAVVSSQELQDPQALSAALEPLQSETARFELLFQHAKEELDRLDIYHLSRLPPGDLIEAMRRGQEVDAVQNLVAFLHTLARAADTFEALQLPKPHIRDYLRHLYLMNDWNEMARLVRLLEAAVAGSPSDPV